MYTRKIIILAGFVLITMTGKAQLTIDLETGAAWNGYNDVEVPNDGTASRFSLTDGTNASGVPFFRIDATYTIAERHSIRGLLAPLQTTVNGDFSENVNFAGTDFSAGSPFTALYQFNSYRLTYRYNIDVEGDFRWGLGLTAKIRDAEIELSGSGGVARKTDVGFVPLVNFNLEYDFSGKFGLQLNGDALATPNSPGRAEDVIFALRYYTPHATLKAGYRVLEGGADVDEVYNFTLFHFAVVGLAVTF